VCVFGFLLCGLAFFFCSFPFRSHFAGQSSSWMPLPYIWPIIPCIGPSRMPRHLSLMRGSRGHFRGKRAEERKSLWDPLTSLPSSAGSGTKFSLDARSVPASAPAPIVAVWSRTGWCNTPFCGWNWMLIKKLKGRLNYIIEYKPPLNRRFAPWHMASAFCGDLTRNGRPMPSPEWPMSHLT
jgi:hypothetical protein